MYVMLCLLFWVGFDLCNVVVIGKCYFIYLGVVDVMWVDGIYVDDCSDVYVFYELFDI